MADAEFWQNLAHDFRLLSKQQDINSLLGAKLNAAGKWILIGNYTYKAQFGALASRGARGLGRGTDLIHSWLKALMAENPDSLEIRIEIGDVLKICGASADFCEVLEARAMEAENAFPDAQSAPEQTQVSDTRSREERLQAFILERSEEHTSEL